MLINSGDTANARPKSKKSRSKSSASRTSSNYTTYFTVLVDKVNPREFKMEGNQIVKRSDGSRPLYGSNGKPYTKKYCPWGIGNHDNCIVPCIHCAGPYKTGTRITLARKTPLICPFGPYKGRPIKSCIVADVGPGHVDMFTGVCKRKGKGDTCMEMASDDTVASYGSGRGRESATVLALVNQYADMIGQPTMLAVNTSSPPVAPEPSRLTLATERVPLPVAAPGNRPSVPPRLAAVRPTPAAAAAPPKLLRFSSNAAFILR